ncbi:ABC transporter permease [Chryseolinea sp. T2]|uniref:ABC transporter permease n=1 Tax=Chryseolinea sp. T2 TaxID=3129255 RepID=UPI003077A676
MLQNYLKIALRFMLRQKGFSVINLSGLTIGITCSLLIVLFIQDELNYENFQRDRDRTYRLGFRGKLEGKELNSAQTGTPVSKALQKDIPQIESTLRIASWATFPVRYQDKAYTEEKMLLADSNFFNFFTFKLIQGHPDSVLNQSGKVVLTQSTANKYFGYDGKGESPVGKVLMLAQGYPVTISGIAADPPRNSHFRFTMILSLNTWVDVHTGDWITGRVLTYFKIKPGASIDSVNHELPRFIEHHLSRELHQLKNMSMAEFKSRDNDLEFFSQPLASIHLRSQLNDEMEANSNIQYVFIFGSVAVLITLLACINFMNLSTARSATRAKEIGVRKSVGAQYHRLILQFLFESYVYVIGAMLMSLFLVMVFLPVLNIATAKDIHTDKLFHPYFIAGAIGFTFIVGLLAGSYPAFYLTHFNPVEVLKGELRAKLRSYGIRNALVVIQFVISTVLIIATMVIYLQLQYVQQANIGFDKSNILNLLHTKNLEKNGKDFKRDLMQFPGISSASYCNRLPPNVEWKSVFRETDSTREYFMSVYEMDADHLETMRYSMVSGRFFSGVTQADTMSIILNETAAKALHMEDFEGRTIETNYDHDGRKRKVIGIMRDFNFLSFREQVQPLAVVLGPEPNWEMAIRITRGNVDDKISLIESFWKKYAPNAPFEYTFLDKNFVAKHNAEQRLGTLSAVFSGLVIFIACIGLFGLAAFTADQRTKEIGIRKVMGASVNDIVIMINKDFLRPVIFANIVAWPLAGWLMYIWIRQFAYHISFPWWVFVLATLLSLIIAFVSVSLQSRKAAIGNPVDSLRNE